MAQLERESNFLRRRKSEKDIERRQPQRRTISLFLQRAVGTPREVEKLRRQADQAVHRQY